MTNFFPLGLPQSVKVQLHSDPESNVKRALMQGPPVLSPIILPSTPPEMAIPPAGMIPLPPQFQPTSEQGLREAIRQSFTGNAEDVRYQPMIDRINSLVGPGQLTKDYMANIQEAFNQPPARGLKNRLKSGWKGLLMGQGIAGLVRGISDPDGMNLQYRLNQLAPMAGAAQQETGFMKDVLNRAGDLSQMTGVNPITGFDDPMVAYKEAMAAAAGTRAATGQQRADDYRTWNQERINALKSKPFEQRRKEVIDLLRSGNLNDPDSLKWAAGMLRIPVDLVPKFMAGMIRQDENYNYIDITTGNRILDSEGAPLVSSQKSIEANKKENARTLAGDRDEDREVRKEQLKDTQRRTDAFTREAAERSRLRAEESAAKEIPFPRFPTPEKIKEVNEKRRIRAEEILRQSQGANQAPSPGDRVIKRQAGAKSGRVRVLMQRPDGSTYYKFE
jgi:hypothetical protein